MQASSEPVTQIPVTPIPFQKKSGRNTMIIIVTILIIILVAIIAGLAGVLIGMNARISQTAQEQNTSASNQNSNDNTSGSSTQTSIKPSIEITTPNPNSSVNGKIAMSGKATGSLEELELKVYDDKNNLLGQSSVSLTGKTLQDWTGSIDITASPASDGGKIVVSPKSTDFDYLTEEVKIKFEQQISDRVKVSAPLKDQVLQSNKSFTFRGQAKDFFEGHVSFRIKDSKGNVVVKDFVVVANNYGAFADFTKTITLGDTSSLKGQTGTFEVYEVSQKDGSEVSLLSFEVRF